MKRGPPQPLCTAGGTYGGWELGAGGSVTGAKEEKTSENGNVKKKLYDTISDNVAKQLILNAESASTTDGVRLECYEAGKPGGLKLSSW